jgi:hypothetical protein
MRKTKRKSDKIIVTAVAINRRLMSVPPSGPIPSDDVLGKVSSKQINSQQELPTRNDLQSYKKREHIMSRTQNISCELTL